MSSIRIAELQSHFPTLTRLVAGQAGLSREVSWPAMMRTRPPAFHSLKGGELLLISTEALKLLDPGLSLGRLLQSVARVEVAGAFVIGETTEEDRKLSDSLSLPLFELVSGLSLGELERDLIQTIVSLQSEFQRRAQEAYRQLTELAIEGRGLTAIAQALSRLAERRVVFEERSGAIRVYGKRAAGYDSAPENDNAILDAIRKEQGSPSIWANNRRLSASEPPSVEQKLSGLETNRLVSPVLLREGVVGQLTLLEDGRIFSELDRLALSRAASAFAIEMLRESAAIEAEDRVGATFLDDLLTGSSITPDSVRRHAQRLGLDLSEPQLVIVFERHASVRPSLRQETTNIGLREALESELQKRRLRGICRGWEDRAVVLFPVSAGEPPRSVIAELATVLSDRLVDRVSLGISRLVNGPEGVADGYSEAHGALSLGVRLFGPGRVTYYADLGLYRLLLSMSNSTELRGFYTETLSRLVEHDRKSDGELVRTLEAYFAGHCSPTEAAQRLHVHRNTLLYRLRRIQAVTGLDLDDPETRLALHLALHVGQVLGD